MPQQASLNFASSGSDYDSFSNKMVIFSKSLGFPVIPEEVKRVQHHLIWGNLN